MARKLAACFSHRIRSRRKRFIQEWVRSTFQRRGFARKRRFASISRRRSRMCSWIWRRSRLSRIFLELYPPSRHKWVFMRRRGTTTAASNVSSNRRQSLRLAGATTTAMGKPVPSTRRLRFVPFFARSVGLGPVFFPSQRGLGQHAVHGLPLHVQAMDAVDLQECIDPQNLEEPCIAPLPEAVVNRCRSAEAARQRVPLHPRTKHVVDRLERIPVGEPRAPQLLLRRQRRNQWLHTRPILIRNPVLLLKLRRLLVC